MLRRLALLGTATLAVCLLAAAAVSAESLPPYPGIAYPNGAFSSRCAQLSLASGPTVVQVGQRISASAGPATDQCGGTADKVSWSWQGFNAGRVVSGCKPNDASCVEIADTPTSAWTQGCIDGNSPFGGWQSCGLYFVLDHKHEVSGRVTSSGEGVGGVQVKADCAGGGLTRTSKDGDYDFLLDRGPCKISPVPAEGETSAPAERDLYVTHDIKGVDFQVGCGVSSEGEDRSHAAGARERELTAHAKSGSPCKLDISFKILTPNHVGLTKSPLGFITGTPGAEAGISDDGVCTSGCVDIQIRVREDQGKEAPPLGSTTLGVSVTAVTAGRVPCPSTIDAGTGHLCRASAPTVCGENSGTSHLLDIPVDGDGNFTVRYWAPGLFDPGGSKVKLRVVAKEDCSDSSCPLHKKTGANNLDFRMYPVRVYSGSYDPPVKDTEALAEWASGRQLITYVWDKFKEHTPLLGETLQDSATADLLQQDFKPALPTKGLGGPSWSITDPKAWASLVPLPLTGAYLNFEDALLGAPGTFDFGTYNGWSLLYRLGYALSNEHDEKVPQHWTLQVFSASFCANGSICGPGYSPSSSTPGIRPLLYFEFESSSSKDTFRGGFVTPYQADQWPGGGAA